MPELKVSKRDNFNFLLAALIIFLFSGAVFAELDSEQGQRIMNYSLMLTMVLVVWNMHSSRNDLVSWKLGLALVFAGLVVGDGMVSEMTLAIAQLSIAMTFFALTTWLAWQQVLFTGNVDSNKIVGSICIYIMLGIIWALAYLLVEQIFPGSMKGTSSPHWQDNVQEMIYYSMVTLTTLGYGDITPQGQVARFLAYMEATTGIFYTTVRVASLTGIRLASCTAGTTPEDKEITS